MFRRPSRILIALAATTGCPSSAQHLPAQVATAALLDRPYAEGKTVGTCANEANGKTVLSSCPPPVLAVIDLQNKQTSKSENWIQHDWGIFDVRGSVLFPAVQGETKARFARETLIFNSEQLGPWKVNGIDEASFQSLTGYCTNRMSAPFKGIVTSESSGCAHIAFDNSIDARGGVWTLKTLAKAGTDWGRPRSFWYTDPTSDDPPPELACDSRVAIQVAILSLDAFCSQVVVPLQTQRLVNELEKARKEGDDLRKQLESLVKSLDDAKTKGDSAVAALEKLNEARKSQVTLQASKINALQADLKDASESVATAVEVAQKVKSPVLDKVVMAADAAQKAGAPPK